MDKQLSLFGNNKKHVPRSVPAIRKPKRKYSISHWSYRQRLVHEVSQSKNISWKKVYKILNMVLNNQQPLLPTKHGRRFISTINQNQLSKAVHALYQRKHGNYPLSINKIAKRFKVSKPSMYRAYNAKYKK